MPNITSTQNRLDGGGPPRSRAQSERPQQIERARATCRKISSPDAWRRSSPSLLPRRHPSRRSTGSSPADGDAGDAIRPPRSVRFPSRPITSVRTRPYTRADDFPSLYYSASEIEWMRSESRRDRERNGGGRAEFSPWMAPRPNAGGKRSEDAAEDDDLWSLDGPWDPLDDEDSSSDLSSSSPPSYDLVGGGVFSSVFDVARGAAHVLNLPIPTSGPLYTSQPGVGRDRRPGTLAAVAASSASPAASSRLVDTLYLF